MAFADKGFRQESGRAWPHEDLLQLLALAQHYGVPTRLLDWSQDALIAAYFAASVAAYFNTLKDSSSIPWKNRDDARLCVIAVRKNFIKTYCSHYFRIVRPHLSTNPNLHAQRGVLLLFLHGPPEDEKSGLLTTLENIYKKVVARTNIESPIARLLTTPVSNSGELLRLLCQCHVTGGSVLPGHQGAVAAMKEQALWSAG